MTGLVAEVARLHLIGANVLFDFGSNPDYQDSSMEIAAVDQSGLSLPDPRLLLENGREIRGACAVST